ncbi:hypothetical protein ABHN05_03660 [Brevibacillus laterosporus]|uniref:hypothetical protein n=1 Tax=Brevibacillus laterosporus TaxID=1465 RepID=UPI003D216E2A
MNDAIDTRVTMTAEESNRQVRLDESLSSLDSIGYQPVDFCMRYAAVLHYNLMRYSIK